MNGWRAKSTSTWRGWRWRQLAAVLCGLLPDKNDRVAGGPKRIENRGKNFGAHRAHNRHIETVAGEIAADVAAHQGECRRVPFTLPTVQHDARKISVI
jgi:hypothetical protein